MPSIKAVGFVFALAYGATTVVAHGQTAHSSAHTRGKSAGPAPVAVVTPPIATLERMECHGQCAEYKLSFYDDGQVVYEGKANVSKVGRWHASLPKQAVAQIADEFTRINYATFDDRYPPGLGENPVAVTSFRVGDQVKTVTHPEGTPFAPGSLTILEDRLDAAVQSVEWVK